MQVLRGSGLGLLLLLSATNVARAQGPEVSVHVDPCVPVERGQLERLLAIELGTSTTQGAARAASTQVWVSCSAQGVELRLDDGLTRKSMARALPAASFRDASSTRLLALAIAEFVVASWIELSAQPKHVVEPVGPAPSPAARSMAEQVVKKRAAAQAATNARPESNLSAAFTLQVWSANDAVLLGAGLHMTRLAAPLLAWSIAADFGQASSDVSFGSVTVTTASVAIAFALHLRAEPLAFYVGPGGRLGFTRMQGEPSDTARVQGERFFAPYGGPLLWNRVEFEATELIRLALDLEFGVVTLPAKAFSGTTQVLTLDGVWLTIGLGIGFAF